MWSIISVEAIGWTRTPEVENPWLERRVLDFAHQGGAKEAPSSTRFAIEEALASGADVIELDVHASADGVLFVGHDATVDRTTNGTGAIAELSATTLRGLDAAWHFSPGRGAVPNEPQAPRPFKGRAATDQRFAPLELEVVLQLFPDVALNLDIKAPSQAVAPYEATLARMLLDYGRRDDVIVTSFFDDVTERFRALAPEIGTSAGTNALTAFVQAVRLGQQPDPAIRRHVAMQLPLSYAGVRLIDERLVDAVHRHGLALHVWTVDDEEEMERLVDEGVDGIMSDRPSVLSTVLGRLGVNYRRPS
jgi:glycerophosphoryl diester phosphodiesterase